MSLHRLYSPALALLAWAAALPARGALPTVPAAAPVAAPPTGGAGLLQAALGMLLVLGLIFLCAWAARRFGLQRLGGADLIKVVSSAMVGQRERVVVVEVAGTWLVLGVASGRVATLHTLPAQPVAPGAALPAAQVQQMAGLFAQKLRQAVSGKPAPGP